MKKDIGRKLVGKFLSDYHNIQISVDDRATIQKRFYNIEDMGEDIEKVILETLTGDYG